MKNQDKRAKISLQRKECYVIMPFVTNGRSNVGDMAYTNVYGRRKQKMADIIRELEKEQLRTDLPKLEVGDTVRVFVKVVEGSRERLQNFEGVVIKIQGGGIRKSFTVRRISYGIGVERTFPYNSPRIGRIEVLRHGQVRRAKLFYLRNRVGKAAKVVERIDEK